MFNLPVFFNKLSFALFVSDEGLEVATTKHGEPEAKFITILNNGKLSLAENMHPDMVPFVKLDRKGRSVIEQENENNNNEKQTDNQLQELCIAVKNLTRLGFKADEILGQVNLALDEMAGENVIHNPDDEGDTNVTDPGFSSRLDDDEPPQDDRIGIMSPIRYDD